MASTVNFTGSVDRELLKRAKVIAAKTDTSVNALFNAELRHLVETFEAAESTIRRLVIAGQFPKPYKLGAATLWNMADVEAFITRQAANVVE